MIIFEKSANTQDGVDWYEVNLTDDLMIDVSTNRPGDKMIIGNSENRTPNDKILLLDNTGMVHELCYTSKYSMMAASLADRDMENYKERVERTEYNWCVWCLINPVLATNDMIHSTMGYKMYPIFEKGTFSRRSKRDRKSVV